MRPGLLRAGLKRKRGEEDDPKDLFFISSTGKQIHSASNDLHRLHTKYNVQPVTSQMARRVYETATKEMADSEKTMVAGYLTHSNATAEKQYRVRTAGYTVKAMDIVQDIGHVPDNNSSPSSSEEDTSAEPSDEDGSYESSGESTSNTCRITRAGAAVRSMSESEEESLQFLLEKFPVTVDGPKPKKELLEDGSCWKKVFKRWEKMQLKLRVEVFRCEYSFLILHYFHGK